jgi:hypothetical protein
LLHRASAHCHALDHAQENQEIEPQRASAARCHLSVDGLQQRQLAATAHLSQTHQTY